MRLRCGKAAGRKDPALRLIALLAWLVLAGTGLAAQPSQDSPPVSRADIIRLLGQIPDIAPIREELRALGFKGENLELAVRQSETIYRDPLIAGHIADRVIAAYGTPMGAAEAGGLVWPLIERGLGHLSTGEMKYYYRVEQAMIKAMPERQCGLAVRNRLSDQRFAEVTARLAARLHTPSLREYYRIQIKAARLGAQRAPVRLSEAAVRRVEERINAALTERIAASDNPRALLSAIENLDRAGNAQACEVGRLFMEIILDFEGRDLRDALIYLSQP